MLYESFEESKYDDWHKWYYQSYCKSEHWKILNDQAQEVYDKKCALCSKDGQVIHHRTYEHLGEEQIIRDIVLLCNGCHNNHHKYRKKADLPGYILEEIESVKVNVDMNKMFEYGNKEFEKLIR